VRGGTGDAAVRGIVTDAEGSAIPGASVVLRHRGRDFLSTTSDVNGRFWFDRIGAGGYEVVCALSGFSDARMAANPTPRHTALVTCTMQVAALEEVVTVVAEAPLVDEMGLAAGVAGGTVGPDEDAAREQFQEEVEELKQGLVGGVRAVPVEVPEDGKLLVLTGALPPAEVSARLEVKK
jgi:hypothetical protein